MIANSTGHLELPPFLPLHQKEWQVSKARQPAKISGAAFKTATCFRISMHGNFHAGKSARSSNETGFSSAAQRRFIF